MSGRLLSFIQHPYLVIISHFLLLVHMESVVDKAYKTNLESDLNIFATFLWGFCVLFFEEQISNNLR